MDAPQLVLSLLSEPPEVWARGRPTPSVAIRLVDEAKGSAVTAVSGWRVTAAYVDQAGTHIPFDSTGNDDDAPLWWEIVHGQVVVEGLPLPALPFPGTPFHLSVCVSYPTAASRMVRGLLTPPCRVEGVVGGNPNLNPNPNLLVLPFALSLALRTASKVATVWYAERHFPAFDVELFDRTTGNRINTSSWKIQVSVLDAFGQRANHVVHEYDQSSTVTLENGKCSFSGLRFNTVSSKAGGHYRLLVHAVAPDVARATCHSVVSDKIQILSYRLYHAPKVPLERLTPFDSVAKMPGIGALYAKRFASLGVAKVGHLAAVDPSALGEEGCNRLLCCLRKERGSMTLAKLAKYINQARDIVRRWEAEELGGGNNNEQNDDEGDDNEGARDEEDSSGESRSPAMPAHEPAHHSQSAVFLPMLAPQQQQYQDGFQFQYPFQQFQYQQQPFPHSLQQPVGPLQAPPSDPSTPESDLGSSSPSSSVAVASLEAYSGFGEADMGDLRAPNPLEPATVLVDVHQRAGLGGPVPCSFRVAQLC